MRPLPFLYPCPAAPVKGCTYSFLTCGIGLCVRPALAASCYVLSYGLFEAFRGFRGSPPRFVPGSSGTLTAVFEA